MAACGELDTGRLMICNLLKMNTGACDRLRQVTFCAALACLSDDHGLAIHERRTQGGPHLTTELLSIEGLMIRMTEEHAVRSMGPHVIEMTPTTAAIEERTVAAYRPIGVRPDLSNEELVLAWKEIYQLLRPLNHVRRKLDSLLPSSARYVGLHCRTGDKVHRKARKWFGGTKVPPGKLPAILDKAVAKTRLYAERHGISHVFVAADTAKGHSQILTRLRGSGLQIIDQGACFNTEQERQTTADEFAIDLFGLARCDAVIGTIYSGVSQAATLIGGHDHFKWCYTKPRV